jgi:hypothetical protein
MLRPLVSTFPKHRTSPGRAAANVGFPEKFDYEALTDAVRRDVKDRAAAIHGLLGARLVMRTADDVVQVGLRLHVVRKVVGRKSFPAWLEAEFQWKQPAASKFVRSAVVFQNVACLDGFDPSALYVFSRKKVPAAARAEAIESAGAGKFIKKADAEAIVDRHTGRAAKTIALVKACKAVKRALKECESRLDARARAAILRLAGHLTSRLQSQRREDDFPIAAESESATLSIDPKENKILREYFPADSRSAR